MTDDLEDFARWRDRIEARVTMLETASDGHAAAIGIQKGLRTAMDEDISKMQAEFRAQRGLLQALHDTQQEHTAQLRELRAGQEELRAGLERVHVGVDAIREILDRNLSTDN